MPVKFNPELSHNRQIIESTLVLQWTELSAKKKEEELTHENRSRERVEQHLESICQQEGGRERDRWMGDGSRRKKEEQKEQN